MVKKDLRFPKNQRLSSKKMIKELFDKGSSFYVHPFKVLYLPIESEQSEPSQVLITVPKRNFKKAVDRNLIKRRVREAYRLNRHLLSREDFYFLIAYIYIGKEIAEFKSIENKLMESLTRLNSV